jgi:hypothetical protein
MSDSALGDNFNFELVDATIHLVIESGGGIEFRRTGSGDVAQWLTTGSPALAFLSGSGVLDLNQGSLRLPIRTSYPASPDEGQTFIYNNGTNGKLACFLNGAWRYSSVL